MLETEVELKKGEDERVRRMGEVEEDKQGRRRG